MNEKISIAQWLAFVGPQLLLIFQVWREGRFDRQNNAKNWAESNERWVKTMQSNERLQNEFQLLLSRLQQNK